MFSSISTASPSVDLLPFFLHPSLIYTIPSPMLVKRRWCPRACAHCGKWTHTSAHKHTYTDTFTERWRKISRNVFKESLLNGFCLLLISLEFLNFPKGTHTLLIFKTLG